MTENKTSPKLWATVTIAVALIGCFGTLTAAVLPIFIDVWQSTPVPTATSFLQSPSTVVTSTITVTTSQPFVITPTTVITDNNPLFVENFEDYDLKDSWTDGGGKWSFVVDETGNVVYDIENSSSIFAGYNFGENNWRNYSVAYRARLLRAGEEAPLNLDFRKVTDANSYTLMISPKDSQVIKFVNSKVSGLDYASFYFSPTVWHTVKLEVFDSNIKVYIDNLIVHSITDSSLGQGRLAFTIGPGTHAQFDDIIVIPIGN